MCLLRGTKCIFNRGSFFNSVSCFRRLVAAMPQRRLGLNLRYIHVKSVVINVAMRPVFLLSTVVFPCQ